MAVTEYLIPVLEVIDSRYENFSFTLPDVIADNASSSRVVFGEKVKKPEHLQLDAVTVSLAINGEIREQGTGAAVVGHPANSAAMLANMLARKKQKLKAGSVIFIKRCNGSCHADSRRQRFSAGGRDWRRIFYSLFIMEEIFCRSFTFNY